MLKLAFFRLEASEVIGAGHAIRSLVLADGLLRHGWRCIIAASESTFRFIEHFNCYETIDPQFLFDNQYFADLLVVDSYDLGYEYESHFRPLIKKIMVIDDVPNRQHNCDILLDQTYDRDSVNYKNLVPPNCKLLVGGKYALLRREFIEFRQQAYERRKNVTKVKRILVSMGGSDPDNCVIKILEIIKASDFLGIVDLVLGFSDQNRFYIEQYLYTYPLQVNIYINPNMAKLIYESDFAIGGAGSSMWERCCLGLPTFMVVCSDDQLMIASNLHKANAAINLGKIDCISVKDAAAQLTSTINNHHWIKELHKHSFEVCDGYGVERVLEEIL